MSDTECGLYRKYYVQRLNDPAGKHAECDYYVLDLVHDKHAAPALRAYADACEEEYPELAADLRERARRILDAVIERAMTAAVNVRREECDVYVGRQHPRFPQSEYPWGNPYKVGRDGTLDEVLAKYEAHVRSQPELMARLPELRGKRLGCWCKPKPCHADVLVRLVDAGEPGGEVGE